MLYKHNIAVLIYCFILQQNAVAFETNNYDKWGFFCCGLLDTFILRNPDGLNTEQILISGEIRENVH